MFDPLDTLICFRNTDDADDLAERLSTADPTGRFRRIDALSVAFTGEDTAGATAVLLDPSLMDRHLALLRVHSLARPVTFRSIVVAQDPDTLVMIKAIHFGFDDVLNAGAPPAEIVARITSIVAGRDAIHINPALASVDLVPGLYRRSIRFTEETDGRLIELLALGLADQDISVVLGIPVQSVRNRISRLLGEHGLSSRTQLATLHIRNLVDHREI